MNMLHRYNQVVTGVLGILALHLLQNLIFFRPVTRFRWRADDDTSHFVSVLVPARNEAETIKDCLDSLLQQDYPNLEVLVLDDHSTDSTRQIVERIMAERYHSGRLRLLQGSPLPPGWFGKSYACQQLAEAARGDYLLFTDADTIHRPEAIATALGAMLALRADTLTLQPSYTMQSRGERLTVPLLQFVILTLLPTGLVLAWPQPSLAIGIGPFMLFQRSTYEAIGGHASVRNRVLDDVSLARRVKQFGFRLAFLDGSAVVSCRLYRNFAEVWRGFSKNLFAFYNDSLLLMVFGMLTDLALFVLPAGLLGSGLAKAGYAIYRPTVTPPVTGMLGKAKKEWRRDLLVYPALQLLLGIGMRLLLSWRYQMRLVDALFHPVGILVKIGIGLNSAYWHVSGKGPVWKERRYATRAMGG